MHLLHTSHILLGNYSNSLALDPAAATIFRFPIAIILVAIVVTLASGVASIIALRRHHTRRHVLKLFALTLVAGLVFTPTLVISRIVVANDHLEETIGFWPIGSSKYLAYHDIAFIHPETVHSETGVMKRSPGRIWHVQDIHGQSMRIQLSNLWELHESAIKSSMQQYGVVFRE
jgi:hypothetical protein